MHCTNYKAEVEALVISEGTISEGMNPDVQVVVLTVDRFSVRTPEIVKGGIPSSQGCLGRNQICLNHPAVDIYSIPVNEETGKLGAEKEQAETKASSYKEMKTIIQSLQHPTKLTD